MSIRDYPSLSLLIVIRPIHSIIAIHGLNGHAFDTWEHRNNSGERFMWLRDGLPERIPGARILIYGYSVNVQSVVETGRLRTFADDFLEKLRQLRGTSAVSASAGLLYYGNQ